MKVKRSIPLGVKILSIFYSIGALFLLLLGTLSFYSSYYIAKYPTEVASAFTVDELTQIGSVGALVPFFVLFGVICLALAVLDFFLGRGFWRGQAWARITILILSGVCIAFGIIDLFSSLSDLTNILINLGNIAIAGIIIWYLLQKHVIHYFAKKKGN